MWGSLELFEFIMLNNIFYREGRNYKNIYENNKRLLKWILGWIWDLNNFDSRLYVLLRFFF